MKLLLIDDEVITRKGLLGSIDWKSLQIHQVLEAEDGLQGLELARKHSPEIVMTDIRMPRMDGISFADRLRSLLPNTSIIFMSGYSDKDYLRAAIRLKAVSYVEKPINNEEVVRAVTEAVRFHEMMERNQYSEYLRHQEKASQLTLALTRPIGTNQEQIMELIRDLNLPFSAGTCFCVFLLTTLPAFGSMEEEGLDAALTHLQNLCQGRGCDCICALKYDSTVVICLFGDAIRDRTFVARLADSLREQLTSLCSLFLATGPSLTGVSRIYESYNQAAVLMQGSFFCDYNSILTEQDASAADSGCIEQAYTRFHELISRRDCEGASQIATSLFTYLRKSRSLLASAVKDLYFKLFISMEDAYRIQLISCQESPAPVWDRILSCNTLKELHEMLMAELRQLSAAAANSLQESGPVSLMKEYIFKNYTDPGLSVKDISEYACLSVAYACTVFKSETGKTLNQYLTEYRMEKARQLLQDPRIRVADISTRIGYLDGGYFSKSFKKVTGLTPTDYREKLMA
ncbi:MAG: response regulator [Lachnospiraceae bacterium]|nr:response regulator [Lachnospiraceae bacterium]